MRDLRMKIAGIAVALGLGGFAGYAISSKNAPPAASGTLEGTKVVRRTIHAKPPKHKAKLAHARTRASRSRSLASEPVSTGSSGSSSSSSTGSPVHTGSSGSSGSGSGSSHPVNTGSSGASGGSRGGHPVSTGSSGGGGTTADGEVEKGDGGKAEGGD